MSIKVFLKIDKYFVTIIYGNSDIYSVNKFVKSNVQNI